MIWYQLKLFASHALQLDRFSTKVNPRSAPTIELSSNSLPFVWARLPNLYPLADCLYGVLGIPSKRVRVTVNSAGVQVAARHKRHWCLTLSFYREFADWWLCRRAALWIWITTAKPKECRVHTFCIAGVIHFQSHIQNTRANNLQQRSRRIRLCDQLAASVACASSERTAETTVASHWPHLMFILEVSFWVSSDRCHNWQSSPSAGIRTLERNRGWHGKLRWLWSCNLLLCCIPELCRRISVILNSYIH